MKKIANKVRREKFILKFSLKSNMEKIKIVAFADSPFDNLPNGGSQDHIL